VDSHIELAGFLESTYSEKGDPFLDSYYGRVPSLYCLRDPAFKSVSWVVLASIPVGLGVGAGNNIINFELLA